MTPVKQVSKQISEENLLRDLSYVKNGTRFHDILFSIVEPGYGLTTLEPGCGSGKLSMWYALRGASTWLLDIDPGAIDYAAALWNKVRDWFNTLETGRLSPPYPPVFQHGSILKLPYPDEWFDFVFNEGVPHHWGYDPHDTRRQRSINQMARVAKRGGWVCVMVSNMHCERTREMAAETEHTYPGMPPKQKPFTQYELCRRLVIAGLDEQTVNVCPVSGDLDESEIIAGWGRKL